MSMAGSMALYSSSPPAIWPSQCGSSPSAAFDVDAPSRFQPGQQSASKPSVGGLSSLFSNPHARHAPGVICDVYESVVVSNFSPGMSRSRSQNDLCTLREGTDNWLGAVNIPTKVRECSPVSVFQGPSSYSSNLSSCKLSATARDSCNSCGMNFLDGHLGFPRKRHSVSLETTRRPLTRYDGFDISREDSWSSFTSGALGSCIEYEDLSDFSDDLENAEILFCESGSLQPGSWPDDAFNIVFSPEEGLTYDRGHREENEHQIKAWSDPSRLETTAVSPFNYTCLASLEASQRLPEEILKCAQSRHEFFKDPFVVKAFSEAERAHRGQFRATGDPYLCHCVETALLLALAGASKTLVAAGLLHDTLDDASWDVTQLREVFGDDVANLVGGVSRLSEFSQLARDNNTANKTLEADRFRTMFLAMVDVRVVLIKLADRLHNMRTLGALSEAKQHRIAKETLEIFAPLASRLGIWSWKAELEDLCFKYLEPQKYQWLVDELAKGFREATMLSAIQKLDQALRLAEISFCDLCGRSKNLYSVYSKMLRKGRRVDEIYDVRGLRLLVSDEKSCYAALDIIHQLWAQVPGKLKDYITRPKDNGYQSLHSVVMGDDGLPLEVQIRTMEMHYQAEFGLAAHWRYKEGDCEHFSFISQRVEWARWVLTWHSEMLDSKLRLSPLEKDLRPPCPFLFHADDCPHSVIQNGPPEHVDDPLFVIILEEEKMMVQELPLGSTAADLLRTISISSWKETRLKINHKIVHDIQQKLQMGDLIEFIPFITPESLDKCRERIRRMYDDNILAEGTRTPQMFQEASSTTVASVS